LFFAEEWTDEQRAKAVELVKHQKTRTSMFSSIPMRCEAARCIFAETCPLHQQNLAPKGKACPIEMAMVSQFTGEYMEQLDVSPDNLVEVSMVRDLVDQEVQYLRKTKLLAKEHFIQENIIGIDKDVIKIIKFSTIEQGLTNALAVGTWGSSKRKGVAQMLQRLTYMQLISSLRRVITPQGDASSKVDRMRYVHNTQWEYNSDAIGNRTYNTNVSYSLDLNTNWMDQYNANRFQELLTSPQAFYFNPETSLYHACTVEATAFENFRQKNKILIKQSVTIKLALNTPING
jgi:hypothetical protein